MEVQDWKSTEGRPSPRTNGKMKREQFKDVASSSGVRLVTDPLGTGDSSLLLSEASA